MDIVRSLDVLFPPFAEQVFKFDKKAQEMGFFVFETLRSFDRQMEIWQKGRALQNGVWVVTDPKLVATKAKPGYTYHQYGCAFDDLPDGDETKQGLQWSWADTMKDKSGKIIPVPWKAIGKISASCGMEWGGNWKFIDIPHHQNSFGCLISELYPILTTEGLDAVWKKLYTKVKPSENVVPVTVAIPAAPMIPKEIPQPIHVVAAEDLDVKKEPGDTIWSLILKLVMAVLKIKVK